MLLLLASGENQVAVSQQRQEEAPEKSHPPLGVDREPGYQGQPGEVGTQSGAD